MARILKNKNLEIHIDAPLENYNASRFDWTGKIAEVKFQDIPVTGVEKPVGQDNTLYGKGFYNEFGIDSALGFHEAGPGGWFHKIGVGLLKKDDPKYQFIKNYRVEPAEFDIHTESNRIAISCQSESVNGYAYVLRKTIELDESSFTIRYHLENRGEKDIRTTEYVHNFLAVNRDLTGRNYLLEFPFQLMPELFEETVNPEGKVNLGPREITFKDSPLEPFFFSNLTGGELVDAQWTLKHPKNNIALSEHGSFKTDQVNLWGWKHVISPELFIKIFIEPGQSKTWSRRFQFSKIE